ncbi:glycosyltransferase family 4 protein [Erwinia sp. HDF1-3R]|uniref:glycosyltransferase family 4 protein n=1 Tax=Erwinia sp. HDF1-3R TaxID=3141543 RepID=UPI0031F5A633
MIKVLHCYKTYYPDSFGGIEQVIYQLSEGGNAVGIQSTVFTLSQNPTEKIEKLDNHYVFRAKTTFDIASTPFSFSAISQFKELAADADLIHYHFPFPFMDMLHFLAGIKKPSVVSYHSDIVKQKALLRFYTPLMNHFLSRVNRVISASPNYAESSSVLQQIKQKVDVIPYGLDKNSYLRNENERIDYWSDKYPDGFFLFVGAFRYYKGLHTLIEAAKLSTWPIVLIGSGHVEQSLKDQAAELGVKNIHFIGALSDADKAALLKLSTCLVFPSHLRSEAFGISLLEGAMYSKPLISCEIGTGTTFINIDGETGIAIPPSDPIALRKAMDFIWDNPDKAILYGQAAHKRFENLFTAETMVNHYADLYRQLLKAD